MTTTTESPRLTEVVAGGGCACKIPAAQLETLVAGLAGQEHPELLVGLNDGDDAAAVRLPGDFGWGVGEPGVSQPGVSVHGGLAIVSTADFFTPVVDDPYDWGRIAAANALSDVYAMGARPILAINLLAWPVDRLDPQLIPEVLRGGLDVATQACCPVAGGHSITAPEPLYGMAVTGHAPADRLLRIDAAQPGLPLSLTKPLGVGVLNNRHKRTGVVFAEAVESMVTLNDTAAQAAVAAGVQACTDVTGFGLLGHLYKMCRASGVSAVVDVAAVPVFDAARRSLAEGFVPGGTRRNLDWVREHLDVGPGVGEADLLLLADAQTSGGLLVVGEVPGSPVIGYTEPMGERAIRVR